MRRLSITIALDMAGGDLRAVARFPQHADSGVLGKYDDNRPDMAGQIPALLAGRDS